MDARYLRLIAEIYGLPDFPRVDGCDYQDDEDEEEDAGGLGGQSEDAGGDERAVEEGDVEFVSSGQASSPFWIAEFSCDEGSSSGPSPTQ